jgi:hypothetical protein
MRAKPAGKHIQVCDNQVYRLHELVAGGEGIAIAEQGLSFGGGVLQTFGVNSNTCANGFFRGLYKKKEGTGV